MHGRRCSAGSDPTATAKTPGPDAPAMLRWLACGLALSAALAGCGSQAPVPAGIPVDGQGDPLPTVEGFVVDEAIRPMANASVRILGEDVESRTDDKGHYALLRPTFAAENVLVTARAPGYVPRSAQVQASGQTSSRIDFRLEPDPYQVARQEILQHRGTVACQAHVAGHGQPCDPPRVSLTSGIEWADLTSTWMLETSMGLAGAVLQVHWDAETPLTERLTVRLRGPVVGCCEQQQVRHDDPVLAEVTATSPVRLEVPEAAARGFPSWSALWLEIDVPEAHASVPAAFARQQSYDAYASLFYVDPAPPGYQLS